MDINRKKSNINKLKTTKTYCENIVFSLKELDEIMRKKKNN